MFDSLGIHFVAPGRPSKESDSPSGALNSEEGDLKNTFIIFYPYKAPVCEQCVHTMNMQDLEAKN